MDKILINLLFGFKFSLEKNFIGFCDDIRKLLHHNMGNVNLKHLTSSLDVRIVMNDNEFWPVQCEDDDLDKLCKIMNCKSCKQGIKLGTGCNGNVYEITCDLNQEFKVACKLVKYNNRSVRKIIRTIRIYQHLYAIGNGVHKNIAPMLSCFVAPNINKEIIATFYFPVYNKLCTDILPLAMGRYMNQLYDALLYLQSVGIAHLDIKWANIVIDGDVNSHLFTIKLIDFEIWQFFGKNLDKVNGTPPYISWILEQKKTVERNNDIWAFFVMCFNSLYQLLMSSICQYKINIKYKFENIRIASRTDFHKSMYIGDFCLNKQNPLSLVNYLNLMFNEVEYILNQIPCINIDLIESGKDFFTNTRKIITIFEGMINKALNGSDDSEYYKNIKSDLIYSYMNAYKSLYGFYSVNKLHQLPTYS